MAMTAWAAKFLHQFDLLVGEWPDLLTVHGDCADQLALLEHWHGERVRTPPSFDESNDAVVFPM